MTSGATLRRPGGRPVDAPSAVNLPGRDQSGHSRLARLATRLGGDWCPAHARGWQARDVAILRNADCVPPELEARKESARLGALLATAGTEEERNRLSGLRADAELRYRILAERRRR